MSKFRKVPNLWPKLLGMKQLLRSAHPPIGVGCMLAVLVMWAITLSAIACALAVALFSWRLG
jgi:hypothetical protein